MHKFKCTIDTQGLPTISPHTDIFLMKVGKFLSKRKLLNFIKGYFVSKIAYFAFDECSYTLSWREPPPTLNLLVKSNDPTPQNNRKFGMYKVRDKTCLLSHLKIPYRDPDRG